MKWVRIGQHVDGPEYWVSVLLHQGREYLFPYLKAIYWVRVQGKSIWVVEWRTECFWGLWIPPPRIRNSILERNDGISAELLWRGQTGCTALFLSTRACWWTQSALIKDLSTLHIKTVECEEHIINDCGQVRMLSLSFLLTLYFLASQKPSLHPLDIYVQNQYLALDENIGRQPKFWILYRHWVFNNSYQYAAVICITFIYLGWGICWASMFLFSTTPHLSSTVTQLAAKCNSSFLLRWPVSCSTEQEALHVVVAETRENDTFVLCF